MVYFMYKFEILISNYENENVFMANYQLVKGKLKRGLNNGQKRNDCHAACRWTGK
jgi:hypothetical protein